MTSESVTVVTESVEVVIAEINTFVSQHPWMDFIVQGYDGYQMEISGSRDEYYWSEMRIVFIDVFWSSIRFQGWKSDTGQRVLFMVEGDEARDLNLRYQIEIGNHLFKFVAEDFSEPMWIAAQGIRADFTRVDNTRDAYPR